jgi:hypothetical protein
MNNTPRPPGPRNVKFFDVVTASPFPNPPSVLQAGECAPPFRYFRAIWAVKGLYNLFC